MLTFPTVYTICMGMVATVESPAEFKRLKPRALTTGKGNLTPDQKIQARTLYLVGNLGPKDISAKLSCDYRSVTQLISNAGWAKLRNKNWLKAEAEVTSIVEKDIAEVSQRIAVESEELTVGSLRVLRESIAKGCAKDMQMASGAARNLVDIFRKCRGMDLKQDNNQGTSTNVNMFVFATPAAPKAEKNVTPAAVQIT